MSLITRATNETKIRVELGLTGGSRVATRVPFLDHMMVTLARYAGFGLIIEAEGDLRHHIIEDVAIAVGLAVRDEFPPPIRRYGHQVVPMDDAVVECALDLGGRPYYRGRLPSDLYDHWIRSPTMPRRRSTSFAGGAGIGTTSSKPASRLSVQPLVKRSRRLVRSPRPRAASGWTGDLQAADRLPRRPGRPGGQRCPVPGTPGPG